MRLYVSFIKLPNRTQWEDGKNSVRLVVHSLTEWQPNTIKTRDEQLTGGHVVSLNVVCAFVEPQCLPSAQLGRKPMVLVLHMQWNIVGNKRPGERHAVKGECGGHGKLVMNFGSKERKIIGGSEIGKWASVPLSYSPRLREWSRKKKEVRHLIPRTS